jgi:hypothetical protein
MIMLQILILAALIDWPFSREDEWDEIANHYPNYCG